MKIILKIFALPVLLLVKVIWFLGNMITNIISYVIGFLLLIIGGCAIYCIVKAMWTSLGNSDWNGNGSVFSSLSLGVVSR